MITSITAFVNRNANYFFVTGYSKKVMSDIKEGETMKKKPDKKTEKAYQLDFSAITPRMQIKTPDSRALFEKELQKSNDDSTHCQNTQTWE